MASSNRELFLEAVKTGDKQTFLSLLPHISISEKGVMRILKLNMKLKHDFILRALFLKKYIGNYFFKRDLLYYAIYYKYELGVLHALKKGASPNAINKTWHPLTYASRYGNTQIVKILLEHGAEPNPQNDPYKTPMSKAVETLNMETIRLLQDHGVILDQKLLKNGLVTAARKDRFDLVDQFLLMGAKFQNSTYFGTVFSNPAVIPKLLKRDFTFTLSYDPYINYFCLAVSFGYLNTLKEFIKFGRDRTPIEEFRKTISAGLYTAAYRGHTDILKYLISQGADINFAIKDKTAYDAAIITNHFQTARLIKNLGGKSYLHLINKA